MLRTGAGAAKERCLAVLRPLGDELRPLEDHEGGAKPGETVVVVGLKHARTGDTLVLHKGPLHAWALPGVPVPPPVFSAAVVPADGMAKAKALSEALAVMARDDPSLVVGPDPEDPDTLVSARWTCGNYLERALESESITAALLHTQAAHRRCGDFSC